MPKKPSRNGPCPCGSGKKYKKCCLTNDAQAPVPMRVPDRAVAKAIRWLSEHHASEVEHAIASEFLGLSPEQVDVLDALPEDLLQMVQVNAFEWLLAEGAIYPEGDAGIEEHEEDDPVPVMELVLGPAGPNLDPDERRYLESLGTEPLDLYEVVESVPGEGLWLRLTFDEASERFWVVERSASQMLSDGDVFAARVLPLEPAVLSGAVYPFPRELCSAVRSEIRERPGDSVSTCVIDVWLRTLLSAPPQMVHGSTGEPLALTTLRFGIQDRARLEKALDREPDVLSDKPGHWVRVEPYDEDSGRILCSLTVTDDGDLELFAQSAAAADRAASWLNDLVGDAVRYLSRESVDPRDLRSRDRTVADARREPDSIPPDVKTALAEQVYRRTYADWADVPIPALRDKTPREAIRTKAGRRDVIELLRSYELGERRQAQAEKRDPADLGFLWDELGLSGAR